MEYVVVLVVAVGAIWWYYNKRLKASTRHDLENQVKADAKTLDAEIDKVAKKVQKAVAKKNSDNG